MKSRSSLYVASLILLIFLGFLATLNDTHASLQFQATWGGARNDVAQSVTLDSSGNIYVTGYTNSFSTSGIHVFLLKFDKFGTLLWQKTWGGTNSEYGRGVGVDAQGNVYVVGYTSSFAGGGGNDVFLLKWNSSGALIWQRTWGGTGDDLGFGLAVNASHSIYATGYSTSTTAGNPKVILLKFDTSGNLIWQRMWGGGNGNWGQSVAVDSAGGVYVTGSTVGTGKSSQAVLVLKFDSLGNLNWQRTWGGTQDDEGYRITVDQSRNVYVTGATMSAGAGNNAALILKLSSTGSLLWEKTWGGYGTGQGQGVTVDSLGYVYLTGLTSGSNAGTTRVFLLSLNFAGSLLWQTVWGAVNGTDFGLADVAAGSGYVVASGFVSESGPYTTSSISASLQTPTTSLATPAVSAIATALSEATPSGVASTPTGTTNYGGGEDAFIFEYGAPTAPTPPSGLVAVAGQRFVNLSWNTPAFNGFNSITNYKVYRGTTPGGESLLATIGNVTKYTDLSIAGGVTYYYKVTAINSVGESGASNEASPSSPPTTPPTPPSSLTATSSTGEVVLRWAAPASSGGAPITSYNVYRGITSGSETLLTSLAVQTSYNDTSVVGGTAYYYEVTAVNVVGESGTSNEAVGHPVSAPTPPRSLQAISGLNQIVLSWNPPSSNGGSPIQGYDVFKGTSSGSETPLASLPPQLSYTDTGVSNNTSYFYEVRANNAIGPSGFSNEVSAQPSTTVNAPSAPSNLAAKPGKNNITLTWAPPLYNGGASIEGYNIYRSTTSGSEVVTYLLVANQTSFTDDDPNLQVGVNYYYQVSAVNTHNLEGPRSNEAYTKPFTTPSSPQNLQAITGQNEIILSWNPPSSNGASVITGYRIYRNSTLFTSIGNQSYYIDTAVTAGAFYSYNVSAVNAAGEGLRSSQAVSYASSGQVSPSPPQNLIARSGRGNATLTWTPPVSNGGAAITNYTVWRGVTPGSETLLVTLGNQTTYIDSGLQGGTSYYYYVKAVNSVGVSRSSEEAVATPTSTPSIPLNLMATGVSGKVTLTWNPPSSNGGLAITGYKIYRGASSGSEAFLTTVNGVNQLSYTDSSVIAGRTYYYKITAVNALGESGYSNEASGTPVNPPGPPTSLTLTPGINNITLIWGPPANNGGASITSYQIWRGQSSGSETLLTAVSGSSTSYTDTGLAAGTTYYYYLKAVNSAGAGTSSTEVFAKPLAPPPPPTAPNTPQNLQASSSSGNVTLTWSPPQFSSTATPIMGYKIYRGTTSSSETFLMTINNVTTYTDASVTKGVTYYYEITAYNSVGESANSIEASVTVPAAPPPVFPIIPVAIAALVVVAVAAIGIIFWRRRVSQRLMMPP